MILLAIFGSPRENGNTDLMLESFLEGASSAPDIQVKRVLVRNLKMSGCLGCGFCDEHGMCVQSDDMDGVYPLFDTADRIVIASPVYFYGLPGQAKLLIDRSQAPFMRKLKGIETDLPPGVPPAGRKGFFLSAGATRGKRLFECAVLTVRYFFDALDVAYAGELCFREIDEKGAINRHPTALEECRKAGKAFVSEQ